VIEVATLHSPLCTTPEQPEMRWVDFDLQPQGLAVELHQPLFELKQHCILSS
jgi:hypothetical protein